VRWLGCGPDTRPRVYFANHSSHFDFLVLWASLPSNLRRCTRPVAARDYWEGGLRRYLAVEVFHALLIDRHGSPGGSNPAVEEMLAALDDGCSLIVFPEGTRGAGIEPAPFRSGLYNLAVQRPNLALVPVYLGNLQRVLPKGEFLPVPLMSSVVFGTPIQLDPGETRESFLERARVAIVSLRQA
jgi:1-acyl-sn-glycerol-3-phosphate acyltransferase